MENYELKLEQLEKIAGGNKMTPEELARFRELSASYERWQGYYLQHEEDPMAVIIAERHFKELNDFYTEMWKKYGAGGFVDV